MPDIENARISATNWSIKSVITFVLIFTLSFCILFFIGKCLPYISCSDADNIYYLVHKNKMENDNDWPYPNGYYDMYFNKSPDNNGYGDIFFNIYLSNHEASYYNVGQKYLLYEECEFSGYSLYPTYYYFSGNIFSLMIIVPLLFVVYIFIMYLVHYHNDGLIITLS